MIDVARVFLTQTAILARVTGKRRKNDLLLVRRILADQSLEGRFLAMQQAVFEIRRVIPILNAEGG